VQQPAGASTQPKSTSAEEAVAADDEGIELERPASILSLCIDHAVRPPASAASGKGALRLLLVQAAGVVSILSQLLLAHGFLDASLLSTTQLNWPAYVDNVAHSNFYRGKTIEICEPLTGHVSCFSEPIAILNVVCSLASLLVLSFFTMFEHEMNNLTVTLPVAQLLYSSPVQCCERPPMRPRTLLAWAVQLLLGIWAQVLRPALAQYTRISHGMLSAHSSSLREVSCAAGAVDLQNHQHAGEQPTAHTRLHA
jgi:hypothetical protein